MRRIIVALKRASIYIGVASIRDLRLLSRMSVCYRAVRTPRRF